jgi:hypothetical protein
MPPFNDLARFSHVGEIFLLLLPSTHEELVRRDGVLSDALARGVIDRVSDGSGGPCDADFTDAARTDRVELKIRYTDHTGFQDAYVSC